MAARYASVFSASYSLSAVCLQTLALLVGVRKSCSVLFLRAGVQLTLDPYAKAFYIQAHFASPGRGGVWLMMCASVCVTEV